MRRAIFTRPHLCSVQPLLRLASTFDMENVSPNLMEHAPAKQMKVTESLRVKKLSEAATLPVRGSAGAAGYDLARYDAVFSWPDTAWSAPF